MKKIIYFITVMFALTLMSCSNTTKTFYTVTFDADNGDELIVIEVEAGKTIEAISEPSKENHQFIGWYKDDKLFDFAYPIEEDTYLIAKYEKLAVYYTVIFNYNEKTVEESVLEGDLLKKPENPYLEGFNFIGWFLSNEKEYDFNIPVTSNLTLYAKYEEKKPEEVYYKVTFDNNDGSEQYEVLIKEGNTIESVLEPIKKGYSFEGWLDSNGVLWPMSNPIFEDMIFVASWVEKEVYYKVTFENEDGSVLKTIDVLKESLITDSPIPVKEGYLFKNWTLNGVDWDLNVDVVINDITLVPCFEIDKTDWIHVYFSINGDIDYHIHQPKGLISTYEMKNIPGYDFLGWEYNDKLWDFENQIADFDIHLNARLRRYYTITFDTDGGEEIPDMKVYENETFILPYTKKDGHLFYYWALGNSSFTDNMISNDITLKAIWKHIYYISFNTEGDTIDSVQVIEGDTYQLKEISNRKGYYFNGWLYKGEVVKEVVVDSNITLDAKYREVDFDISILADWEYYLYMDKVYATKYIGSNLEIIVPDVIDDLSSGVFNECDLKDSITSIKIVNENINYADTTFNNLNKLSYFELKNGDLKEESLRGCYSLEKLITGNIVPVGKLFFKYGPTVPETLTYIKLTNQTELYNRHFEDATSLKTIIIEKASKIADRYVSEYTEFNLDYLEIPFICHSNSEESISSGAAFIKTLVINGGEIVNISENTNKVILHDSVKKIISYGYTEMPEIILPKSLIYINGTALYGCGLLKKIVFPDDIPAIPENIFVFNENLEELVVPFVGTNPNEAGMISDLLGNTYFIPLKSVIVTKQSVVHHNAFDGQEVLETIIYNEKITSIGDYAFNRCFALKDFYVPEDISYIGAYAFSNCSSLTEFIIPTSIEKLNDGVLNGCIGITEITIPSNITSIGSYALACLSIRIIEIPETVVNFGSAFLYGCNELLTLTLPFLGTNIDDSENARLDFIGINNENSKIKTVGVTNAKYLSQSTFENYSSLEQVSLNGQIKKIPHLAFNNCTNLIFVKFPIDTEYIGQAAFSNCVSLRKVDFNKNLKTIDYYAFANCENLDEIFIYENLTSIAVKAFAGTKISIVHYTQKMVNWTQIDFEDQEANPLCGGGVLSFYSQDFLITTIISKEKIGSYALVGLQIDRIFYSGTEEEFESLIIGDGNDLSYSKIYYYSETEPTISDKYWYYAPGQYENYLEAAIWKI